ncbi:MAG: hypothetical protein J5711_05400 [Bacteroidales bacterium]|nr:hypothetical protein [Bacteroidales bacterium]
MTKRLIYLQSGFWNKIRAKDSVEDKRVFWDLYGALECSNIVADIPEECWKEDELLYRLAEKSADGSGVKIIHNDPKKIEQALDPHEEQPIENLCAVYLLDKDTKRCDGISNMQGILCINVDILLRNDKYVRGAATMYTKGEPHDKFAKCKGLFNSFCNSALIIDPYIARGKNSLDWNLIPLLDAILPETSPNAFHLTIMCDTKKCYVGKNIPPITNEKIKKHIKGKIKEIRANLNLSLTLCHIETTGNGDGDFHSRHICTNNMLINSEDGFDLFKWDREKNEYVCGKHARIEFLFPTLMDNRRLDGDNYYRWIQLAAKNISYENSWGTRENRLFELVKD